MARKCAGQSLRQPGEAGVAHRALEARLPVVAADGFGQFGEHVVGGGQTGVDVPRLVRQAGIETAADQKTAVQHAGREERAQGSRLGVIEA